MARFRNMTWEIKAHEGDPKAAANCTEAQLAVLMDIRDELQTLNRVFACPNARAIPDLLREITRNTTKRKYTRRAAR